MNKSEKFFVLTIFFLIITLWLISMQHTTITNDKTEDIIFKQQEQNKETKKVQVPLKQEKQTTDNQIKIININSATPLSYKTKEEVYTNRKHYVMNSIFANDNYEPSDEVFGQVEGNKPWVSTKICKYKDNNYSDIEGPSEEARYINNPEVLVAVEYAFYGHTCENYYQKFVNSQFPIKISYNEEKKEITNEYTYLPFCDSKGNVWYSFKGLNARDLGYKYAYLDLEKSTFKPHFKEEVNISNSIIEFQDFIHVGGSCSIPNGCNNASPNQPPLNFAYPCTGEDGIRVKNRALYIKLWKERPQSSDQEADITQKIIIRKLKLPQGE